MRAENVRKGHGIVADCTKRVCFFMLVHDLSVFAAKTRNKMPQKPETDLRR